MAESPRSPLSPRRSDAVIAYVDGRPVSVGEALARASSLAAVLPDRPYVINLCSNRYEFLIGFCAAIIAGQCTLMPPNRQSATLLEAARSYAGCYVLGGEPIPGLEHVALGQGAGESPAASEADPSVEALDSQRDPLVPLVRDDQLCAIVFTSGSTGESQPNRKYWHTLRAGTGSNARLMLDSSAGTVNLLATVPPQHMWGLETSILLPMLAGAAISGATPLFPLDIFDALRALPRPRALVSSPVHLSAFLGADAGEIGIDTIFTATAPMPTETARALEARYGARVIDVFGSSESGILAARRPTRDETWQLADAFSLRRDGSRTLIVADHLGESVPLNDRVEILDQGRFRWVGRDQDMINIAGKRGSLADLNQRLQAIPGVQDGVVFLPEPEARRLAALVVAPTLEASDILAALREGIDQVFLPRPVYLVPALPRQETSKLPRRAVLDLFAELRQQRRATRREQDDSGHDD